MIKVSIIVPIYNVEKYLSRSIESLRNQKLKDIEIILINDGSKDNSLKICKEYEKIDERIKVIDKENGGVSSARNTGLEVAKGEYIGFIDPDDWVEKDMFYNMYEKAKDNQSDVVMCNYITEKDKDSKISIVPIKKEILSKEDIINDIIPNMISTPTLNSNEETIMGSVWRLLIRKELIYSNDIIFPLSINFMEDLIFCIKVLTKANKLSIDKHPYYHYVSNNNSAVAIYRENFDLMQRKVFELIYEILNKERIYNLMKYRMEIRYVSLCINSIINEMNPTSEKSIGEKIKIICKICKDKELKQIIERTNTKQFTLRKKIILFAIKNNISIYLFIYYSIILRCIK